MNFKSLNTIYDEKKKERAINLAQVWKEKLGDKLKE
jgi:hypothetical protein